jgi:N utilization substance protein B
MFEDKNQRPEINNSPIDDELDAVLKHEIEGDESFVCDTGSRRGERILAFCMLYAADRSDYTTDLDHILQMFTNNYDINVSVDSFAYTLAKGAIESKEQIEEEIKPYLKNWKLERLGCCTRLVLQIAFWEFHQADAIPSVIINEAIELAKLFAEFDAYRFVNGILDEYCKQKGLVLVTEDEEATPAETKETSEEK